MLVLWLFFLLQPDKPLGLLKPPAYASKWLGFRWMRRANTRSFTLQGSGLSLQSVASSGSVAATSSLRFPPGVLPQLLGWLKFLEGFSRTSRSGLQLYVRDPSVTVAIDMDPANLHLDLEAVISANDPKAHALVSKIVASVEKALEWVLNYQLRAGQSLVVAANANSDVADVDVDTDEEMKKNNSSGLLSRGPFARSVWALLFILRFSCPSPRCSLARHSMWFMSSKSRSLLVATP